MRKGYLLLEVVAVVAVVAVLSIPLARLSTMTIRDIPQFYRVIQVNTSVLNMLEHLHKDINAAAGLPESFAEYTTDDKLLLIELADGVVCYQLEDAKVLRRRLTNDEEDTTVWPVPSAKIKWQLWRKDNKAYAVEIRSYIELKRSGRPEKKMANSHLYFVGAYQEPID